MTIDHAALAVASGAVIGFALGATGGGGSLLAVPLIVYVLAIAAQPAAAMSLVVVGASALLGVYQRKDSGDVKVKAALVFSTTGAAGAWAGALGHRFVRHEVVLLLFGLLMVLAAWQMWRRGTGPPQSAPHQSCAEQFPRSCWIKVSVIGFAVGLLTGFFGVGGGFVIVPALAVVLGFPAHMAMSTSLLIIALVSAVGLFGHLHAGQVDWPLTGLLLIGSVLGMSGGTWLMQRVSPAMVTKCFAVVAVLVAGVMILHNGLKLLGLSQNGTY
jgi:uncharacterized membrane protein YfcA